MSICVKALLPSILTVCIISLPVHAETSNGQSSEAKVVRSLESSGRFRLSLFANGGMGLEKHEVGLTTQNETIEISAGGGGGVFLTAGYFLTHAVELEAGAGFLTSSLSQQLENAEGSFNRTVLLGNLGYRIPVSSRGRLILGGGLGMYMGGEMDLDFSSLSAAGGAHNRYFYDDAVGYQLRAVFEWFTTKKLFGQDFSAGIGLQYTGVSYDLNRVTSDGQEVPLSAVPAEVYSEMNTLDGSGVDILFYLFFYL